MVTCRGSALLERVVHVPRIRANSAKLVRMSDAATEAARQLAQARWGSTRVDGLLAELKARADQLGDEQRAELRALVEQDPKEKA
jgi:hypothetical protein